MEIISRKMLNVHRIEWNQKNPELSKRSLIIVKYHLEGCAIMTDEYEERRLIPTL